jgi:hypothetical protein
LLIYTFWGKLATYWRKVKNQKSVIYFVGSPHAATLQNKLFPLPYFWMSYSYVKPGNEDGGEFTGAVAGLIGIFAIDSGFETYHVNAERAAQVERAGQMVSLGDQDGAGNAKVVNGAVATVVSA